MQDFEIMDSLQRQLERLRNWSHRKFCKAGWKPGWRSCHKKSLLRDWCSCQFIFHNKRFFSGYLGFTPPPPQFKYLHTYPLRKLCTVQLTSKDDKWAIHYCTPTSRSNPYLVSVSPQWPFTTQRNEVKYLLTYLLRELFAVKGNK